MAHSASGQLQDDSVLRQVFDSRSAWEAFSKPAASQRPSGLFRNPYLTRPPGFLSYAQVTLAKAQTIVDKVLSAASQQEYRVIVQGPRPAQRSPLSSDRSLRLCTRHPSRQTDPAGRVRGLVGCLQVHESAQHHHGAQ